MTSSDFLLYICLHGSVANTFLDDACNQGNAARFFDLISRCEASNSYAARA